MPDYFYGKIYKIHSPSHPDEGVYIGSTCQPLSMRMGGHRRDYKKFKNGKISYVTSFKFLEYDDAIIELVCKYPCNSKQELNRQEGEHIKKSSCCSNKNIAGRSRKEYYDDNREQILEYKKEHYLKNRDVILESKKLYYIDNKNQILEKQKLYYNDNKDRIAEYYQKNKIKLKEKVECECGCIVSRYSLSRHKKTKKHQALLLSKNSL